MKTWFASTALIATLAAAPVLAQETVHLRGTVQSVSDSSVSFETTSGDSYDVGLTDDFMVLVYEKANIVQVGPGDFLSIPSVEKDGMKVAVSINVFPEEMRGTGEGERAWDLTEQSLMTNATVGEVIRAQDGRVLLVEYNGVEEPVLVNSDTPITEFGPAPDRKLQEGDQAILFVTQGSDGAPIANLAGVSEDGSLPPL